MVTVDELGALEARTRSHSITEAGLDRWLAADVVQPSEVLGLIAEVRRLRSIAWNAELI